MRQPAAVAVLAALPLAALLAAGAVRSGSAGPERGRPSGSERAGPEPGPGPVPGAAATLYDFAFLSGCWAGPFQGASGEGVIEERWTSPSENVMLATTRYLVDGRATQWELGALLADHEGIRLVPYPAGRRSEHDFRLTRAGDELAVFEAPEHDFPKRIVYRREGDALVTRVDAGEGGEGEEWRMARVECD